MSSVRPIRVVLVTDSFPPRCGGSGWSVFHLARALRAAGHEVRVMKPAPNGPARGVRDCGGIQVIEVGFGDVGLPGVRNLVRERWLARRLRSALLEEMGRRAADLIHGQHLWSGPPAVAAAAAAGLPSVLTVRDHWPICYFTTWHVGGERCPGCRLGKILRCMRERSPRLYWAGLPLVPYMRRAVARRQQWLRRADAVVAVSAYLANVVVKPVVGGERTHVIPNLVDVEGLRAAAADPPETPVPERFVLFAGKFVPLKGSRLVLEVARRLGPDLPVIAVGDGPDRPVFDSELNRGKVALRLVPWVENLELVRMMQRALAVLVPSLLPEALNRTVLEAMAVGTPVLATASGGIHDQIEHGRSGLILPPDPDAFVAEIRALAADTARRRRLADEALRRARERFDRSAVLPQIEALYRRLVGESRWAAGGA